MATQPMKTPKPPMTLRGKILIALMITVVLVIAYNIASKKGLIDRINMGKSASLTTSSDTDNESGGKLEVLKVCINTWCGFGGGIYFNEGFAPTENSRFYKDYGFKVEFVLMDDFNPSRAAWKNGEVHLLWATIDAFPTEAEALSQFEPKFTFILDKSRGGDNMVAVSKIKTVNDLVGKKIAVAMGTPGHSLFLNALDAAGVSVMDIEVVQVDLSPNAAKMFKAGQVDAAVVWSPDDEDCMETISGSHILTSSAEAKDLIADGFVVKGEFLSNNKKQIQQFIEGWLIGNAEINTNTVSKEKAAKLLSDGFKIELAYCQKGLTKARLVTLGDNVNFFGLNPEYKGITGNEMYEKMKKMYSKINMAKLSDPTWVSISDPSLISALIKSPALAQNQDAEQIKTFTPWTEDQKKEQAFAKKSLIIEFLSNSSELDAESKNRVKILISDNLRTFQDMKVRLTGHSDNSGNRSYNIQLSKNRAQSVADFLKSEYAFDQNRFYVLGLGPDKPVADNNTETGRQKNRRTEIELIKE